MKLHYNKPRQSPKHEKAEDSGCSVAKNEHAVYLKQRNFIHSFWKIRLLLLTLNRVWTQPCALSVIIRWRRTLSLTSSTDTVTNTYYRKFICRNKAWHICHWVKYQFRQAWESWRVTHVTRLLNGFTFHSCKAINCCTFRRDCKDIFSGAVLAAHFILRKTLWTFTWALWSIHKRIQLHDLNHHH